MKNYFEGTWDVQKLTLTEPNGFEYKYKPQGKVVITKSKEHLYWLDMQVILDNENQESIHKMVQLKFTEDYKSMVTIENNVEFFSSVYLITKDELLLEFSDGIKAYKFVGEKQ